MNKGFTTIELLAGIVIIAVIISMFFYFMFISKMIANGEFDNFNGSNMQCWWTTNGGMQCGGMIGGSNEK